jgi:hypothetical protein
MRLEPQPGPGKRLFCCKPDGDGEAALDVEISGGRGTAAGKGIGVLGSKAGETGLVPNGSSWLELVRDGETELLDREPGFQRKKLHPFSLFLHYKTSANVNRFNRVPYHCNEAAPISIPIGLHSTKWDELVTAVTV